MYLECSLREDSLYHESHEIKIEEVIICRVYINFSYDIVSLALLCDCWMYSSLKPVNSCKPVLLKAINTMFPSLMMLWSVYGFHSINTCTW